MWPLLLGALAHAGVTYSATLEIVGPRPDDFDAIDPRLMRGSLFWARGQEDLDVVSDWPYLRCTVKQERVTVAFLATAEDWPERFPERAICRSGDFKLVLNLRPRPMDWDRAPPAPEPVNEVVLRLRDRGGTPVSGAQQFLLPPGTYTAGVVQAVDRSGEPWPGLFCKVSFDRRTPWVLVLASDQAPAGQATCELPQGRRGVFELPVLIER